MKQEKLQVTAKKKRACSSYQEEITPAVPNVIQRNFHADFQNEKWLTDITEFAIPVGKVYLSPVIDCFDGMPICWSIGTAPNAELTNNMLDDAISHLKEGGNVPSFTQIVAAITAGWLDQPHSKGEFAALNVKERVLAG